MEKIQNQAPSSMTSSHCPKGKNHSISRCKFQCTDSNRCVSRRYDFYLVPQRVNQGTVAPTNYNVIYDQMGLQPDQMQILTYKLSHLYVSFWYIRPAMLNDWNFLFCSNCDLQYNWSGTVRVPAVCRYATKLAVLVSQVLHQIPNNSLEKELYFL